jgi:hypothetical protein
MKVKNEFQFQLDLAFFGLTSTNSSIYRKNIFTQIHEIVFHGKGGYDWYTIYNMPIWLRNFTFHRINDFYEKEKKTIEDAKKGKDQQTVIDSSGKVSPPQFKQKTSYK